MDMTFDVFDRMLEEMEFNMLPSMYQEIGQAIDELRETYAKPVEMTQQGYDYIHKVKYEHGLSFVYLWNAHREYYIGNSQDEVMRAWLHPELIKVVE